MVKGSKDAASRLRPSARGENDEIAEADAAVGALVLAFTALTFSATAAPFPGGEDEIAFPDCYPADEEVIEDEELPLDEELPGEEEPVDGDGESGDLGFFGDPILDDEEKSSDEKVECGDGDDEVELGEGDDEANGADGDDVLHGGPGQDKLSGAAGKDTLIGEAGKDLIKARDDKRDVVNCGAGRDRVRADKKDKLVGCEVKLR